VARPAHERLGVERDRQPGQREGACADVLERRAAPLGRAATPVGSVEQWARTQTPAGAVFAVPPSWSGFRSHARRAVVVDFKAFPFQPEQIPVWFERLADLAPISLPERADPRLQATLDDAFLRRAPEALARAASRYGIDYVVRHRSAPLAHPAFELTHDAGPWLVYRYRAHEPELA
ncbi:MAG: DUF6798 domain-containing protein, partial [Rhodothermales bacterium]|nr:DUF6798 domain-containing protein [Rhodothermales bacterium]